MIGESLTYYINLDLLDVVACVECRQTVPLDNTERFEQETHGCNVLSDIKKLDPHDADKIMESIMLCFMH